MNLKMASVYILYSGKLDRFYIGSSAKLEDRLIAHREKRYSNSYTAKADDWELFYHIDHLSVTEARRIELHIKNMKSRRYLFNLKQYDHVSIRLKEKYKDELPGPTGFDSVDL